MKYFLKAILIAFFAVNSALAQTTDYVEFDDRKNVVHGVYLGVSQHYGKISGESGGLTFLKVAYVANKKFEIGLAVAGFYSLQPNKTSFFSGDDILLFGGYGGLHLEPILFGNRFISVSFPLLIGAGRATILERKENGDFFLEDEFDSDPFDYETFFIAEPGVNILYNISRFVQIETGIRYRIAGNFDLPIYGKDSIKGFSVGAGLKIGIFNLGRNKKIKDNF